VLLAVEAFDHMLALLHEAETLAMALDDQRRLGRICVFTASTFRETYDFDRARAYGQRALAIGTVLDDMTLQVLSRFYLGEVDFDLGDYPQAIDCFKRNVMALQGEWLYDHLGNLALPACQNRLYLVRCLTYLGDFAEGMAVAAEAVQLAETVGRPFERVAAYTRTGYLHLLQGNFHQAISVLERGQVLVDDASIVLYTFLLTYLAVAYARTGRTDKALHLLEEAIARKARLNPLCVVETYLLAGRLADAHTVAQHRLEHLQRRKLRGFQVHILWLLGEIAMQREPTDLESAAAHYRQALTLANELGMRPFQAHCHSGLGKLYRHTGRLDLARAALSTAIDLYRSMAMTFWLPEAEAALAQVEGH
jgi:tetratricopeptide (TPR) repeat protein